MKKNYMAPLMECHQMGNTLPLCNSPYGTNNKIKGNKPDDFWDDDFDLTYGGIDYENDGLLDPS